MTPMDASPTPDTERLTVLTDEHIAEVEDAVSGNDYHCDLPNVCVRSLIAYLRESRTAHAALLAMLIEAEELLIWATGYGSAEEYPPIRKIVELIPRIRTLAAAAKGEAS